MTSKKVVVLEFCNRDFLANPMYGETIMDPMRSGYDFMTKEKPSDIGMVIFGGGVDVDPSYYGEPIGNYTQRPNKRRDKYEFEVAKWASQHGIPMLGSCRGAQLLTIFNGGKLIQHVNDHAGGEHGMYIPETDDVIETNSYHHQMMFPWVSNKEFKMLAIANPKRSQQYLGGHDLEVFREWGYDAHFFRKIFVEPEIIYWPGTKALCIQGHPEWMPINCDMNQYVNKLIDRYFVPSCEEARV
jgi:GMP synthase-like glutamine amidotransferase